MAYSDGIRASEGVDFEDVADLIDGTYPVLTTWSSTTITPSAGTVSSQTDGIKQYYVIGKVVYLQLYSVWTQNTSTAAYVTIPVPYGTAVAANQTISARVSIDGTTLQSGYAYLASTTTIRIAHYVNTVFATGANKTIAIGGFYFLA